MPKPQRQIRSYKLINNSMMFKDVLNEYYSPEDDKLNQTKKDDTRRPRLTLRHLNKLRKVRELKKLEMAAHKNFVKVMYGAPPEGEEPMM